MKMSIMPRPVGRKESVIRTLKLYERMYKNALKNPEVRVFCKTAYTNVDYVIESGCWLCEYKAAHNNKNRLGCDPCPFFSTYHIRCFSANDDIAVEWLSRDTIKWALKRIYGLAGHFNYYTYKYFKEVHEDATKGREEDNLPAL